MTRFIAWLLAGLLLISAPGARAADTGWVFSDRGDGATLVLKDGPDSNRFAFMCFNNKLFGVISMGPPPNPPAPVALLLDGRPRRLEVGKVYDFGRTGIAPLSEDLLRDLAAAKTVQVDSNPTYDAPPPAEMSRFVSICRRFMTGAPAGA